MFALFEHEEIHGGFNGELGLGLQLFPGDTILYIGLFAFV